MKNVEDIYPLSPMQQRILFHTLSSPGTGMYSEQISHVFDGEFNILAFQKAWEQVIVRHPILRTAFLFVWIHHHLLLDNWSVALLLQEISILYSANCLEQKATLPSTRPSRDYVEWIQKTGSEYHDPKSNI